MKLLRIPDLSKLLAIAWIVLTPHLAFSQTEEKEVRVPQNLLKLIHSAEVQHELGLEDDERLLKILKDIDRVWWPSRNLPEAKQMEIVRGLESKLLDSLQPLLTASKLRRLREIEVQSQGVRSLVRPGIAKTLGLDNEQLLAMKTAFLATDVLSEKLSGQQPADPDLQKQLQAAAEEEQRVVTSQLTVANRQALAKLVGEPFETRTLKRIYPLAPELIDSGEWAGLGRTTLEAERGKVVLLHFYAFQCHNCVANFQHYNRWQDSLSKKGVKVIGLQTPETAAERDATRVKQAATEKGFAFPVLIDLQSANWNVWGNTMWPTVYVVDKNGYIRSWWQGELNWEGATGDKTIEKLVDELLAE